ncbi:MAG TPA: LssY C-terminal domain-containing protein [Candidatus Acidoferrales bacterium]|nr:LssY C-terminal domain-containing protein [Candidatus Acidoferrales bacterium]
MRITKLLTAFFILGFAVAARPLAAQSSQATQSDSASATPTQIDVSVTQTWTDTKMDVRSGEKLQVTATGSANYPDGASFTADGLSRGWKDMLHQYAVPDAGHGALIARIGSTDGSQPFLIGASKEFVAPVAGRLFLGINESEKDAGTAQGSFHLTITILSPGLATPEGALVGGPAEAPIPSITAEILGEIPRRVSDPQGNPGDMVNIFIVGTQDQLTQTFAAAGWVQVDRSVESTLAAGLEVTLAKKDYLTMPMSTLYLFKRPQDFGFAHAEPVRVVMSRNHLRAWKSAYMVDGRPLWCIAATHDIGFERDQRNNGVTHKIDPAIDGEREYVNDTLSATGLVAQRNHLTPSDPLTTAKTATGGEFHSDGRILVLVLSTQSSSN